MLPTQCNILRCICSESHAVAGRQLDSLGLQMVLLHSLSELGAAAHESVPHLLQILLRFSLSKRNKGLLFPSCFSQLDCQL